MYKEFVILLRGLSQVFLLRNALSGALILVGLFCSSWQVVLLALLGGLISRAVASLWKVSRQEIADGLYSFNGVLVGIAIGVYWEITWLTLLLLVVGASMSTWLARSFRQKDRLPGLTAPFIIVVWGLLLISLLAPHYVELVESTPSLLEGRSLWAMLGIAIGESIGQVMCQANVLSGLLFLLAIVWDSRRKALYALLGVLVAMLVIPFVPKSVWCEGLLGYNAVLCAIYWAGSTERPLIRAVVSVVLSVVLELLALYVGIIPLTAPFVLSVWAVWLWTRRSQYRSEELQKKAFT